MAPPVSRLQAILGPLPPRVVRALEAVPAQAFLPPGLAPLAGADAPLPFFQGPSDVALTPSPRLLALLLQLLEPEDGMRALVVGAESGYLGALLAAAGAAKVRIVQPSHEVAEAARGFVEAAGFADRVEVRAGPPAREAGDTPWDRVLLLDPRRTLTAALGDRLAESGFALALPHTSQGFEVAKTLRSGGGLVELRAARLRLGGTLPGSPGPALPLPERGTVHGLLLLEEMAQRVWRGQAPTRAEAELRAGVEATWRRPEGEEPGLPPEHRERRGLAQRVFHLGFLHQAAGDVPNAADLYQRSAAVYPTAEAPTFLGWARAQEGRLEEAIACCHRAIATDPTLGNPYNDIGAYLVELGRPGEAVPWLERALRAPRYEAPFFPHLNLARVRLAEGDAEAARTHLRRVLELNPGYPPALEMLRQLESTGA